jgi:hypothetical protein
VPPVRLVSDAKTRTSERPAQRVAQILRARTQQSWSALRDRGGQLVGQLSASAGRRRRGSLFRQALEARERGNVEAAFSLLREEAAAHPGESDVTLAFWDAAVACGQPAEAGEAMLRLIRQQAASGEMELAVQCWLELSEQVPAAMADALTLARIAPVLQQREAEAGKRPEGEESPLAGVAVRALRQAVDPANNGLTAGVALRLVDLARALDPPTALAAARRALESDELHQAKRDRLEATIAELEGRPPPEPAEAESEAGAAVAEAAPAESGAPAPLAEEEAGPTAGADRAPPVEAVRAHPLWTEQSPHRPGLSDEEAAALAARLPPSGPGSAATAPAAPPPLRGLEVREAVPVAFAEEGLSLEVGDGRKVRVEWPKIEALAIAEVEGAAAAPVTVIDLVLDWRAASSQPLRILRLRSDGFDARSLAVGDGDPSRALPDLLAAILAQSGAQPLPHAEAVNGVGIPIFESLAEYEREVLGAAAPEPASA